MKICSTFLLLFIFLVSYSQTKQTALTPDSARIIARDAWIYGYPMFYNYKSMYLYAMDKGYPDNAGGFNRFKNYGKSFSYRDTSVVTPNNDTPYSWAILNLTDEPVVLEVPEVRNNRYYVLQFIDLYTYNFAYVGTRAQGNKAGRYLIAGPNWKGEKPPGITKVFNSETNLVTLLGRTELFDAADMVNVKAIQSRYKIILLHTFLGKNIPEDKKYSMPLPVWKESDYQTPAFINILNSLLQYTSVNTTEVALRKRFAQIGIEPGKPFDALLFPKDIRNAINEGIKDGEKALAASVSKTTSSMDLFGTRKDLRNNYLKRATAAGMGLFGNTKEEAVYMGSMLDNQKKPLMGGTNYVLRFSKDQIPPVDYFWSITMYDLPHRFLVKNPIDRYSIGDRTKGLKFEENGDLVIYFQSSSPGKEKESNWLPTPSSGPFNYIVRLYGPKETILNGEWKLPFPEKISE